MPIYPGRTPGTHRVTVFANGKQHEKIVQGTKAEARAFEARERIRLEAARPSTRVAPTLRDFCVEVYTPHAKTHLRENTWRKVRRYQVATLCAILGGLKLTALSPAAIEDYKSKRLAATWRDKPVKPGCINNELRVLRTVMNYAAEQGYPTAPTKWKRLPVRGASRVHVWTPTQIGRLFAVCASEDPELLRILVFLVNTGCRKGEAIAAEWSWVDRQASMLRIPSNDVWRPKNGKPREVPLPSAALEFLPPEDGTYVFQTRGGGRFAEFPKDRFNHVRDEAKLKGGPHSTRHTYASAFLARCPDMFLLAKVMGHSHTRVTELYSHLLPDHLDRARNAVNFAPPPKSGGHPGAEP